MPKNKQFIDKKNSVTFNLVHRSQQDPLIVDENAPQRVLLQAPQKQKKSHNNREELHKWGIFYDDDYDYMQHLKPSQQGVMSWEPSNNPTNTKKTDKEKTQAPSNIKLPSSVFASKYEEDEGLLMRAAPHSGPRPDLDPDIVAALDEDFDYSNPNNILDDDFIQQAMANAAGSEKLGSSNESLNSEFDDEMFDDVASLNGGQFSFRDEETKSRFTEYSMSSSVMRRNEQLSLLDSRFEKLYEDYNDTEIGALDCDEIEGEVPANSEILLQYAQEFEKSCVNEKLEKNNEIDRSSAYEIQSTSDSDEELVTIKVGDSKKEWDCESILSTYSTLYNHPRLIEEPKHTSKIKINSRTGMPISTSSNDNKLTIKSLAKFNNLNETAEKTDGSDCPYAESVMSTLSVLSIRPKNETPLERNQRKKLLKEYRQERRIERKANTIAFKNEKKRQEKILMNNRNNVQGNKIL